MKKSLFILLFLSLFALVSCSKEDDVNPLVGNWLLIQLFLNDNELQLSACDKKSTIEMNNNNTYIASSFLGNKDECKRFIERGVWLIDDEDKLIITPEGEESEKYIYSFVGSTLITEFHTGSSKSIWSRQ